MKFIKGDAIEKNLIKLMNEKLTEAFTMVNYIISKGFQPDKLNISLNKKEVLYLMKK